MGPEILVPLAILAVIGIAVASMYNGLVRLRNTTNESWSDVETELQRRYDLVPNLVSSVKGYADHEKGLLEEVVRLREDVVGDHGSPEHQAQTEGLFEGALGRLMVRLEAYPDLKASSNFNALQKELANTEDRVQAARRFYNANVRDLNNRVQTVPSNLIAGMFGFTTREYFEPSTPEVHEAPKVEFGAAT